MYIKIITLFRAVSGPYLHEVMPDGFEILEDN